MPVKKRPKTKDPKLGAKAHKKLNARYNVKEIKKIQRLPKNSDNGAQKSGPKQYPTRYNVMTSPAASGETWKCSAMPFGPFIAPDGLEDAKVALITSKTDTMDMYHLLLIDQFNGFSISPGAKSKCPSSFR